MTIVMMRGARLLAIVALFASLLLSGAHTHTEAAACTPVYPTIGGFIVPNAPPSCAEAADAPAATGDEDDPDMPATPAADPADPDAPANPDAPADGDGEEG